MVQRKCTYTGVHTQNSKTIFVHDFKSLKRLGTAIHSSDTGLRKNSETPCGIGRLMVPTQAQRYLSLIFART